MRQDKIEPIQTETKKEKSNIPTKRKTVLKSVHTYAFERKNVNYPSHNKQTRIHRNHMFNYTTNTCILFFSQQKHKLSATVTFIHTNIQTPKHTYKSN